MQDRVAAKQSARFFAGNRTYANRVQRPGTLDQATVWPANVPAPLGDPLALLARNPLGLCQVEGKAS